MSDITSGIRINALDGIDSATASDNDYLPLDTATGTKKITFKEFKKKVLGKTIPDKAVFSDNILKFYHTKETGETSDTFLFQVDLSSISSGGGSGQDGVGISNIAKTGTSGLVDTYTITLTDNSTYTFTVTNGKDGASASTPTLKKLTINGVEYDGTEEVNITIDSSGASIAVDNTLSSTSLNPISNKAVTEEFNNVRQEIPSNTSDLNNDSGFLTSIPLSTSTVVGGVKADAKDSNDTVPVRMGSDGKLYVETYPTGSGTFVVDSELSSTSENPVQNKVIYDALTHKAGTEDLPSIATETESGLVYPNSSYFMVGTDGKLSPKILEELNDDTTSIKFATSKAIVDYVKAKSESKADQNQGTANAGKYWMVGSDGDLTFGIPAAGGGSSGTDGTYYVTPEMYGAKGDDETDDTNAFLQAIQTEKPIVCRPDANYLLWGDINLPETRIINIYGNGCRIVNMSLKLNVNDDETSWNSGESYPQPESTIENVFFDNINKGHCIKTGIPLRLRNIKFNNYEICLKNYGPYMDYMNLDNVLIFCHRGENYAIDLAHLGDEHVFRDVHCGSYYGTDDFTNYFIKVSGCRSVLFEHCLLNGIVSISDSNAVINACHMESGGEITLGEYPDNSNVKFIGCFFWDMFKMPVGKYVDYDSCVISYNHQTYGNYTNDYAKLKMRNSSILCGDIQGYEHMSIDRYSQSDYQCKYSEDPCVLDTSPLNETVVFEGETKYCGLSEGSYTYTFFPSNNPHSVENSDFSKSRKDFTVSISNTTSHIRFYISESYKDGFIWCYRTHPDSTIYRAIINADCLKIWDFGTTVNGILWEKVNSIPLLSKSVLEIRNNVYYSDDGVVNANNVLVANSSTKEIKYKIGENINYVDYILSDGSQWIDTGIIPDGNTEIEYKFQDDTRTNNWENIFGSSRTSYCVNRYDNWSQTFVLRVNDTETLFEVSEEKQQNGCIVRINNAEKAIYVDNVSVGTFSESVNATDPIVLFARRWEASGSNMVDGSGIFKLYYFTIRQNGETVRDFRPATDEDGVVCLYDNVTNRYYYNAGTGSFDYG